MSKEIDDPLSMYDNPIGEVPVVPIGFLGYVDGNGKKMTAGELAEVREVARIVGAGTTERPIGDHNGTVIEHGRWVWVRGALAAALGLTALGLGTAFGIERHRRRRRR